MVSNKNKVYEKLGISEVINARGYVTHLGSSIMDPEVLEAMAEASKSFVEMDKLKDRAGEIIAKITGSEAACVTAGAAAGMAHATAACMTGTDLVKIGQLPDTKGMKNEVIVDIGHMVSYINQVRMTGVKIVNIGYTWPTFPEQLESSINENTAAVFYVVSGHCKREGRLSLEEVVEISKKKNVPVIVDAAAEMVFKPYVDLADLFIYSGGKAFRGPSGTGFICGRKDLIEACRLQYHSGIGRPMKVDKEEIVGLIVALERYIRTDFKAEIKKWNGKLQYIYNQLKDISYVEVTIQKKGGYAKPTLAGEPLPQLLISLNEEALGMTASDVFQTLQTNSPPIHIGDHAANLGMLEIDTSCLRDGEEQVVANKLKDILTGKTMISRAKRPKGVYSGFLRS